MSNEAPPKKRSGFLARFIPTSVAGTAAVLTALILWLTLLTVWLIRWFGPQLVPSSHAISWTQMLIEFMLVLAIPVVLYWGLRRWNQVIEGAYPDIDQAWKSGVGALEAQGVSIAEQPIFLILGSSGYDQECSLINALESQVRVQGIPNAAGITHALQWYANSDAIYLFCSGSSSLSTLAARRAPTASNFGSRIPVAVRSMEPEARPAKQPLPATSRLPKVEKLDLPDQPVSQPVSQPVKVNQGAAYLGTIAAANVPKQPQPPMNIPVPSAAKAIPSPVVIRPRDILRSAEQIEGAQIDGTVFADQVIRGESVTEAGDHSRSDERGTRPAGSSPKYETGTGIPSPSSPPGPVRSASTPATVAPRIAARTLALPTALDTSDQLPRLRYLCRLLKRVRQPRCGINGIVTLIPFDVSREGPMQLSAIAQSARGDVETIQDVLGIRSPLTAVLVGLEQDKGFNELVHRLQPNLLSRRLGGRFDLRSRPTPAELNIHSDRLCDAFEDWVYRLFARDDALVQQRGNRKLYGLISRIRHELKPRLRIVLGEAFGCESDVGVDHSEPDQSFFFSGCYFAASGASTGKPAFVKGVLKDKLIEEQSQVEWTDKTRRTHVYFRTLTLVGWAAVSMLAIFLLAQLLT